MKNHAGVLALFALLTVIVTWPLARKAWWGTIDYGDTLTTAYGMAWQAHALAIDPRHLFDANILYPFHGTLAFDELNFSPALLGAPILWLTGNTILDYNLVTLLSFVLSGYGAWLLVRELTGSSRAGLVAGVAFAYSFFRFNNIAHLTILNAQWLPLVLFWLHRLWKRPTWPTALAFAGFFALQALSSHYLAFYMLGACLLFVVFYSVAEQRVSWAFLGRLGLALALAGLAVAPVAAGYLLGQNGGYHRELADIERYTATFQGLLAVYAGNPLYKVLLAPFADPGPWPWERSLFPGIVAPALAVVGIVAAVRASRAGAGLKSAPTGQRSARHDVLFYLLLTVIAAVMSFGPELVPTFDSKPGLPLPYMLLYQFVPGVQTMRVITRIGALFTLGLSVLAGYGVAGLFIAVDGRRLLRLGLAPALAGLLLLETWSAPLDIQPLASGADIPPLYKWLAAQSKDTVVVEYPMLYLARGPRNVEIISKYEYYSTYDWLRTPNGAVTVRPKAWTALTEDLEASSCFLPCPRTLDELWALGVDIAAVHLENLTGAQQRDFAWRSTAGLAAGIYPGEFDKIADFGDNKVYRIARHDPHPLSEMRAFLRAGASLALGAAESDPGHTGAYIAALGYWLRDWKQYGDPDWSFGQPVSPLPPGGRTDYALLYAGEDPAHYGFTAADARWHNDFVVLYGR